MARHTISGAAKLVGKQRSTLYRHIKNGKLSKGIDENGEPYIETAELVRAYGPLQEVQDRDSVSIEQQATPEKDSRNSVLFQEVETLRAEKLTRLERDLEDMREQRDDWKAQAQKLAGQITDQRMTDTPGDKHAANSPEKPVQRLGLLSGMLARVGL